jgi:hypothetical protein
VIGNYSSEKLSVYTRVHWFSYVIDQEFDIVADKAADKAKAHR